MLSRPLAEGTGPVSRLVAVGGRTLHVRLWPGDPARSVVIWHGITGTGLDHAALAERLAAAGHRVIAPDSLGCGASDWAVDPRHEYGLAALAGLALPLLDALAVERTAWIGASKGGGLGIRLAADAPGRIGALVLCDVGPGLPQAFRAGLAARLATPPAYSDLAAFGAHIARLLARDGAPAAPALAERLTLAWARRLGPGAVGYHYDPGLAEQLVHQPEDFDLWGAWDALRCPALVLRGERSSVLTEEEVGAMQARNARSSAATLAGAGHLAFLDEPAHQAPILAFLESAGA